MEKNNSKTKGKQGKIIGIKGDSIRGVGAFQMTHSSSGTTTGSDSEELNAK